MDKLVNNYEKRINTFVLQMAENPIIVKKEKNKYMTTREALYADTSYKILDKKGFIFSTYKTDKERIKDYLDQKIENHNNKTYHSNLKNKTIIDDNFLQPSMRFKARTDYERMQDALQNNPNNDIKDNNINNKNNKITTTHSDYDSSSEEENKTQRKFKFIITDNDLIKPKKKNEFDEEEERKKLIHKKILESRKNMLKKRKFYMTLGLKKKIDNPNKAKFLRSDLNNKIHFKAMENLTMFKTSTMNHNLFKTWSKEDINQQKNLKNIKDNFYSTITTGFKNKNFYHTQFGNFNRTMNKNSLNEDYENKIMQQTIIPINKLGNQNINPGGFNLLGNKKILQDLEITKEIANSNPLLFNMNFNSIKADTNAINVTNDQLNNLKRLAFVSNVNEDVSSDSESDYKTNYRNETYEEFKKDENVIIDGQEFKKTDTDKIAVKVLKKCNWNETFKKYNTTIDKGKLMFTGGLTLNQFEKKYGIIP